ncbi:aldehyde dehydrogenase [Nocardioides sp. LS1]|uniref:aldehyde dehydrogenase n=1 Tax=Nocardioides sp. LS1 TaxID=1027620 RepID=UPI000F62412C|nr:aldehyde dehydrogenase [Nocardioides sp. LS1]GCD91108.1 aldehyde dehydrogenase [Nocardioides sp. LS1]
MKLNIEHDSLFYGGEWKSPHAGGRITVVSASTEETIGSVPLASERDVDAAVRAARSAFDDPAGWASWEVARRADAMERLADVMETRGAELAKLVTAQNGMPISLSMQAEANTGPLLLRYYAALIRELGEDETRVTAGRRTLIRHEPGGVVAAIVPWNFPMGSALLKLAPALAAGCSVVLKPATETVLDSFLLAQCIESAGIPAGVVNILPADRDTGAYLVGHPGVDRVAFTGSTIGGRKVAARCAELLRPAILELGGKSAAIVLDDADLVTLRDQFLYNTMLNSGQTCWISTRIFVPRSRYAAYVDDITELVSSQIVGDPFEAKTEVGPMVSSTHRDRVERYINAGIAEGARVTTGGGRPVGLDRGWYVEPTILADVDNGSIVAREEIFGPVLCVIPYGDIDEAVELANDSEYGLGGSVWSADPDRAVNIARQFQTGSVSINGTPADLAAPLGGVKASGLGRALGPEGLEEYRSIKSVYLPTGSPTPAPVL